MVKNIIKSDGTAAASLGKLFADGAYDGNDIFRYREQWNIAMHKVIENARIRGKKEISSESICHISEK